MAGSSMDGFDLAQVQLKMSDGEWKYQLGKTQVVEYPKDLYKKLRESPNISKSEKEDLDNEFGLWIAKQVINFKKDLPSVDLLGIHGHTVIHKPLQNISWQLGKGSTIAQGTGITCVTDFRSKDVQAGGQGAPLVPFGDFTLFSEFDACINLGGIANVSLKSNQTAWDICPCNQVLNFFAQKIGKVYDNGGELARGGKMNAQFYNTILELNYFNQLPPKSLPNNYIEENILESVHPNDGLHTYCKIIAEQIGNDLRGYSGRSLITGGGAFNSYLMELIGKQLPSWEIVIPKAETVSFKESIIFAFLALKRLRNEINTLSSVTGASKDSSSGVIHLP